MYKMQHESGQMVCLVFCFLSFLNAGMLAIDLGISAVILYQPSQHSIAQLTSASNLTLSMDGTAVLQLHHPVLTELPNRSAMVCPVSIRTTSVCLVLSP